MTFWKRQNYRDDKKLSKCPAYYALQMPVVQHWNISLHASSVTKSYLTLCDPTDCSPPGSSVHRILQARTWKWVAIPPPGYLPNPGIKPRSPKLQADSLLPEPPGKPKNTRVGSLSLLQGNFLTQESNQGLLNCRWILYQLSYQGSPPNRLYSVNYELQWIKEEFS